VTRLARPTRQAPRTDPAPAQRSAPANRTAAVLALQRTAGNAAAGRVLARDPTLTKPPNLDSLLNDAVAKQDWPAATAILQRYASDADRRTALSRLSGYAGMQIMSFLRSPAGASYRSLTPVLSSVLEPWIDRELPNEVKAGEFSAVALMLYFSSDSRVLEKLRDIQRTGGVGALEAIGMWSVLAFEPDCMLNRALDFLDVEQFTTAKESEIPVDSTTPEGAPVNVTGGAVTSFRDVSLLQLGRGGLQSEPGSFGFQYTGADSLRTGWLQFISMEAETFDKAGNHSDWVTSVETQFQGKPQKFSWGTDKTPIWYLDSATGNAPFYGADSTVDVADRSAGDSGSHISTVKEATIFDRPTVDPRVVAKAFDDDDVAKLVVRLKFHDYLVRGMDVLYENTMTVEFPISSAKGDPNAGRKNKPGTGRPASALAAEHYKALVEKYPKWGFYAHR
jgi:hypothetical protein